MGVQCLFDEGGVTPFRRAEGEARRLGLKHRFREPFRDDEDDILAFEERVFLRGRTQQRHVAEPFGLFNQAHGEESAVAVEDANRGVER